MKQAYTIVTNLLTGEEFPMPYNTEEAIKRAYAIECNELDKYIKGEKDYAIQYGKAFVSCGDFTAKIEKVKTMKELISEELQKELPRINLDHLLEQFEFYYDTNNIFNMQDLQYYVKEFAKIYKEENK